GLDDRIEVFSVNAQDPVHLRQVETNAAGKRGDVTFERGPCAECYDRRIVFGAEIDDRGDLLGAASKDDRVRSMRGMIGLVLALLGAERRRGGKAIAEQLAQRSQQRLVDRLTMKGWCGHNGGHENRNLSGILSITPGVELRQSD